MEDSLIARQLRRTSRNLLVWNLLGLAVTLSLLCLMWKTDELKNLFGLTGILLLAAGLFGWNLARWQRRRGDPALHPVMKVLAPYGDPASVALAIDRDAVAGISRLGKVVFTRLWMIEEETYSIEAARLDDVAWFYLLVTQRRTNGIPTGKSYSAMIWKRTGAAIEVGASRKKVNALIEELGRRCPWATAGYSADLMMRWTDHRPEFLAGVDARRGGSTPPA